jgi:hypothetical protein
MSKIREIKNDCLHNGGYLFTIDYTAPDGYCDTCATSGSLYINRYCRLCRDQMGSIDCNARPELNLTSVEFSSPEFSEWFQKIKGD